MVLKDISSSRTGVDIEKLWQEEAIWTLKYERCFADRTMTMYLANRTAQK